MEQHSLEKTRLLDSIMEKLYSLAGETRGVMNNPYNKYYRTWRVSSTERTYSHRTVIFLLRKPFESEESDDFTRSFLSIYINQGTVRVHGTGYTKEDEQFVITGRGKLLQRLEVKELSAIEEVLSSMGERIDEYSGIDEWYL